MRISKRLIATIIFISCFAVFSFIIFKNLNFEIKSEKKEPTKQFILGFSQIGSESAWRTRNSQSIIEAAEENNIQIIFEDAQQKQENQLKAIRKFIVYQVDVIAFVPIVETGWDNVLQEAKDANIPVIVVDRQIKTDPDLYAGFLGEDSISEGKKAAEFLTAKFKNSTKQKINIVELTGTSNSSVATGRANGFRKIISKDPRFTIVHSEDGDFLRSRGKEIMDKIIYDSKGYLTINGEPIDAIYSHNDSMTLGLLDSLKANRISPKDTVIITIDAEQKSIDELVAGNLNCVIECNPNLGPTLMQLVKQICSGVPIARITYMHETTFTENDDFSKYTPRGY